MAFKASRSVRPSFPESAQRGPPRPAIGPDRLDHVGLGAAEDKGLDPSAFAAHGRGLGGGGGAVVHRCV